MTKNKTALVAVLLLTALTVFLYLNNSSYTLKEELSNFSVDDTASITKLFLADKEGNSVLLVKLSPGEWRVNDKYEVRKDIIQNLLHTIARVKVKSPVPKNALERVIPHLAGKHTKIEIYQGKDKPSKIYYVGDATKDNFGTYMMMENSSTPFVTHIEGFFGYLTTRYTAIEDSYRKNTIFNYSVENIESLEINYHHKAEKSFKIENISKGSPTLITLGDSKKHLDLDTANIYGYLELYQNINFEEYANEVKQEIKDSISKTVPLFTINLIDIAGNNKKIKAYRKPTKEGSTDLEGKLIDYDIDRMVAFVNNDKDFVIIQYYVFDFLTVPYTTFINAPINNFPKADPKLLKNSR